MDSKNINIQRNFDYFMSLYWGEYRWLVGFYGIGYLMLNPFLYK